ncbi:hypothetical protein P7C70_g6434, partial [Phenoliferia sp. Uapishka_3]
MSDVATTYISTPCSFEFKYKSDERSRDDAKTLEFTPEASDTLVSLLLGRGVWSLRHWEDDDGAECVLYWNTSLPRKARIISSTLVLASDSPLSDTGCAEAQGSPKVTSEGPSCGWKWSVKLPTLNYGEPMVITLDFVLCHPDISRPSLSKTLASWVPSVIDSPRYLDVEFVFVDGRTLFSNSAFLSDASPYYKTLFTSGFSETSKQSTTAAPVTSKSLLPSSAMKKPLRVSEDSDTEVDVPVFTPPTSSYRIEVTETSYVTYREVLRWLHTRDIAFAPLTSSLPASSSASGVDTTSNVISLPPLFIPASPKSVYRLADFLDLTELKTLALSSILSQVGVANVVEELMSEVSAVYEPVQDALLQCTLENWDIVRESAGWKDLERKIEAGEGELPEAYPKVSMRLMKVLSKVN